MIPKNQINNILTLITDITSLTEEQKQILITEIENGEPYSQTLEEVIALLIQTERQTLEEQLTDIDQQIQSATADFEEKKTTLQQKSDQIKKELPEYLKKQEDKVIAEMQKTEAEYEKKVEEIIREQGEQSEIDAIHQQLLQDKDPK